MHKKHSSVIITIPQESNFTNSPISEEGKGKTCGKKRTMDSPIKYSSQTLNIFDWQRGGQFMRKSTVGNLKNQYFRLKKQPSKSTVPVPIILEKQDGS